MTGRWRRNSASRSHTAAFAYAPFDMIGDTMRGTEGILCDLYDHPDELLALIDKFTEFAIPDAIAAAKAAGRP